MIKVNVIEKEEEEKAVPLSECDPGDVVELFTGGLYLVIEEDGDKPLLVGIDAEAIDWDDNGICLAVRGSDAMDTAEERGVKRIVGTLTGIEVTAK